jgi:hypothetical protein
LPDHGWRLEFVIGTAIGGLCISQEDIKLGSQAGGNNYCWPSSIFNPRSQRYYLAERGFELESGNIIQNVIKYTDFFFSCDTEPALIFVQ